MKLLYFFQGDQVSLGIFTPKGIVNIDAYQQQIGRPPFVSSPITIDDLEAIQKAFLSASSNPACIIQESEVVIAPCVYKPSKIICIGLNYRKHALESNMPIPKIPVVFTKYSNTLVNHGGDIKLGTNGKQFDYEVELGVVIGKECKNIDASEALEYVLGYCVANDLSCRDLQFRSSQWLMGKSLDHFLPLGKYLVTKDEIKDPQQLQLNCTRNGKICQSSNTADMIFTVAEIIADLSKHMTLIPGDLILTGTPEGVIMGQPEQDWLKPGDVVCTQIEKLGFSKNKMI